MARYGRRSSRSCISCARSACYGIRLATGHRRGRHSASVSANTLLTPHSLSLNEQPAPAYTSRLLSPSPCPLPTPTTVSTISMPLRLGNLRLKSWR